MKTGLVCFVGGQLVVQCIFVGTASWLLFGMLGQDSGN